MPSFSTGEKVLRNRQEYPLPQKAGTQDYIFYFVPAGDPYGKGARYFFNRFYKNHRKKDVKSLEGLIAHLHNEVKGGNVKQIREIIIVAHANSVAMIFPVVEGATKDRLPKYQYLTAGSMVALQEDFLEGKDQEFPNFNKQRKEVIACLADDSWITIRACNFGLSEAGLYSLYSFFGGRANVYAPNVYQFFGSHPLLPDMRLESREDAHQHLVKQRFFPRDIHTPDRKDAVVKALVDPGRFSESVELLRARIDQPNSPQTIEHDRIVRTLNAGRIDTALNSRLAAKNLNLEGKIPVSVVTRAAAWVLHDSLMHQGKNYKINYHLSAETILPNESALTVEAKLVTHSTGDLFPIQLFFEEDVNKVWSGRLFSLASYTDDPKVEQGNRQVFEKTLALLEKEKPELRDASAGIDIPELFKANGYELVNSNPPLSRVPPQGEGDRRRSIWLLQDEKQFLIKLERALTQNGIPIHTLMVYEHHDRETQLKNEFHLMSYLGTSPDQPGTELMAYLDNRSLDELIALIDHLRSPYKAENVIYLHYAILALGRNKDFTTWYNSLPEVKAAKEKQDPLFEAFFPYTNLSNAENEDRKSLVYDFVASDIWVEVKASKPPKKPFEKDLFTEQVLKFSPDEAFILSDVDPDSPANDIDELRGLETQGLERFLGVEKYIFDTPESSDELSCQAFKNLMEQLMTLEGKTDEEIEAALKSIQFVENKSLFQFLLDRKDDLSTVKDILDVTKGLGATEGRVAKFFIEKFPTLLGRATTASFPRLVIGRLVMDHIGVYSIVYNMFKHEIEDDIRHRKAWYQVGRLTAIRQWARQLLILSFLREKDFPDTVQIDLKAVLNDLRRRYPLYEYLQNDYFLALYYEEGWINQNAITQVVTHELDHMKKGFDDGVLLIDKEANEILSKAEMIYNDSLRSRKLDPCKIQALYELGLVDIHRARALVMRQYARSILAKTPAL